MVLEWLRNFLIDSDFKQIVKVSSFSPYAGCHLLEFYSWWNLSKYGFIKVCIVLDYRNCQIMKSRKLWISSFKYFIDSWIVNFRECVSLRIWQFMDESTFVQLVIYVSDQFLNVVSFWFLQLMKFVIPLVL